jgi:hypothetical protein
MEDPNAPKKPELTIEEQRILNNNEIRALTRNKNVNKHINIANAIVRKANSKFILGRQLDQWRYHTQEANRLIERYESNPIK